MSKKKSNIIEAKIKSLKEIAKTLTSDWNHNGSEYLSFVTDMALTCEKKLKFDIGSFQHDERTIDSYIGYTYSLDWIIMPKSFKIPYKTYYDEGELLENNSVSFLEDRINIGCESINKETEMKFLKILAERNGYELEE